ncbi:Bacterial extracellular solute-binding protein, family 3 [compost metagenome]
MYLSELISRKCKRSSLLGTSSYDREMKFISIFFVFLAFTFSSGVHAATYKIFTAVTPPLQEKSGEGVAGLSGVFGKIAAERILKSGKAADFEVIWVPWKRALAETQKNKNGLFMPLARTPEREKEYCWLGHLGTAESWFYVTNPKIKVDNLQDLKKYRIGFLNGSMREAELHKVLGVDAKNLDGLTEDLGNYKKLISGRIDIWATQIEVFTKAQDDYQAKTKTSPKVYALKKFLDQDVWIVGNVQMEEKLQDQIRAIFKTKKKDTEALKVSSQNLLSLR